MNIAWNVRGYEVRDESRESRRQESGKHGVGVCAWCVCVCVCVSHHVQLGADEEYDVQQQQ